MRVLLYNHNAAGILKIVSRFSRSKSPMVRLAVILVGGKVDRTSCKRLVDRMISGLVGHNTLRHRNKGTS